MLDIKNYLEKFSKKVHSVEICKKQILNIIEKNIKIKLSQNNVEIKDCVLKVKSSPGVKNKLFVCKDKILDDISTSVPGLKIVDIR